MASQWTMSFVHTLEDMERLEPEWRELLSHSATRTPFQRHSYARVWWSTLGGGEWPQAELWLATARDSSGRLRGVAPLFFTENKAGRPALLLLGSVEISDYLDFIVSEEDSGAFATTLLEGLDARTGTPGMGIAGAPQPAGNLADETSLADCGRWARLVVGGGAPGCVPGAATWVKLG